MPISRKKSCAKCRVAKARCNLATPCSRCSERSLICNYADPSQILSNEVPSSIRQAESMQLDEIFETDIQDVPFSSYGYPHDFDLHENIHRAPVALRTEDAAWPVSSWSDSNFPHSLADVRTPNTFSEMLEQPSQTSTLSQPPSSHSRTQPLSIGDIGSTGDKQYGNALGGEDNIVQEVGEGAAVIYDNVLSPRKPATTQSFLTTQVLWGQLRTYPEMMIQGQLPPFIYPSCVLNDVLPTKCAVNGVHQCLPNSLAICAGLVSMFHRRTPTSGAFIWKSIYSEMKRLKNEYRTYDKHNLLASSQAINIYLLLQAQDFQSKQPDYVGSMIVTLIDIVKRLRELNDCKYNMYKNETLTQREWAFNESMRRTACIMYIFESLLEAVIVDWDPMDHIGCGGFDVVPLPGPRVLWDYNNTEAWAYRLDRFKAEGSSERVLTIRDLKISGQSRAAEMEMDGGFVEQMAKWCEMIDDFGSLLWKVSLLN